MNTTAIKDGEQALQVLRVSEFGNWGPFEPVEDSKRRLGEDWYYTFRNMAGRYFYVSVKEGKVRAASSSLPEWKKANVNFRR